jgi:hypothetical protein
VKRIISSFVLAATLFTSTMSFALGDIRRHFAYLQNSAVDYAVVGAVCEQVTKVLMQRQYPQPVFSVYTGVAYSRPNGSTIGELDVVVVRNADQKALLVGEVKCWKNLPAARRKAMDQRQRIMSTLKQGANVELKCLDNTCKFNTRNFDQVQRFISISQDGGRQHGFDIDLPYSLDQLMGLRTALMKCQASGQCMKPTR